ncbi:hypothetical protein Q6241_30045, partial [Klebsiella pneumoniae]
MKGFIQQAARNTRRRELPERLLAQATTREGRDTSNTLAQQFFGLDGTQLTCMLYSPFIHHGERLESYLRQCHPG